MPDHQGGPAGGARAAAISNLVVGLVCRYTGHGPTRAKTYLHDDLVTVVLHDALMIAERTLLAEGEQELVLRLRRALQTAMRKDATAGVEQILGRRVIAFLGVDHVDPDIAIESFVLAPAGADDAGPIASPA